MPTRRSLFAIAAGGVVAAGAVLWGRRGQRDESAFVDGADRSVAVPANVARVLAAGPPASVLLYAVAPERMVGWVRAPSAAATAFIAAPYRDLPVHGQLTGRANTASLEQIVALSPDLIVDSGEVDRTHASLADRIQAQAGVPYVLLDGALAKSAEAIRGLGRLLGAEARAERLARYAQDVLDEIASLAVAPGAQRPRVYYGRGAEGLETGWGGSITAEVIEAMAQNVAVGGGDRGLTRVSPEQLLVWDPDVIIAQDTRFRAALFTDNRWFGLKAVRERRVFVQPSLPFGWIDAPPGVNRLIGARWLRSILYGDEADLRMQVREFYELFLHLRLSDVQLATLLQS